jgi:hypothetical protein
MKNYWLDKNTITINEVALGNTFAGKWYITKCKKPSLSSYGADWMLWPEEVTYYLHSDGKWRQSTVNEDREYTGYFDSKEDAEKVLYKI